MKAMNTQGGVAHQVSPLRGPSLPVGKTWTRNSPPCQGGAKKRHESNACYSSYCSAQIAGPSRAGLRSESLSSRRGSNRCARGPKANSHRGDLDVEWLDHSILHPARDITVPAGLEGCPNEAWLDAHVCCGGVVLRAREVAAGPLQHQARPFRGGG